MKPRIFSQFLSLTLLVATMAPAPPLYAAGSLPVQRPAAQAAGDSVLTRIAEIKASGAPFHSSFNVDAGDWDTEGTADVLRDYGPGVFRFDVVTPNTLGWSTGPVTAADFYVEVDAYHVSGSTTNEFGILFRYDGENYYVFSVTSDGFYRLQKWLNGEWQPVLDWAQSPAQNAGEHSHNTLGLLAEGEQVTLLVNNAVLATVTDGSITGDGLALFASSFDETPVTVAFDDFTYWSPTGDAARGENSGGAPSVETPAAMEDTEVASATTATPVAPSTPDPSLLQTLVAPIRSNTPDYSDDFRRADDRWPTAEYPEGRIDFTRRGLNLRITAPAFALWSWGQEIAALNPADMLVEVDVTRNRGAIDDTYGLLLRFVDNDNFYYFGISGAGTYSFWRVVGDEWTELVDWTASPAIFTENDAANRLGVLARGDRFLLLINDTAVADVRDAAIPAGSAGVYAGTFEEDDLDVAFDNLDVWVLSQGEAALPVDAEALAAAQARVDELRQNEPSYTTRFTRGGSEWSTAEDAAAVVAIERGRLRIDVLEAQWLAWSEPALMASDFLVEADVTLNENSTPGEAGILFRRQDADNFYFMAIDNTGRASLWRKEAGVWHAMAPWAKTAAISTFAGAGNRIGVLAKGDQLTAIVNEQAVAMVSDPTFAAGALALAVGSFASPDVGATFDNVTLWEVEE